MANHQGAHFSISSLKLNLSVGKGHLCLAFAARFTLRDVLTSLCLHMQSGAQKEHGNHLCKDSRSRVKKDTSRIRRQNSEQKVKINGD